MPSNGQIKALYKRVKFYVLLRLLMILKDCLNMLILKCLVTCSAKSLVSYHFLPPTGVDNCNLRTRGHHYA
jgi:hypothetical protein